MKQSMVVFLIGEASLVSYWWWDKVALANFCQQQACLKFTFKLLSHGILCLLIYVYSSALEWARVGHYSRQTGINAGRRNCGYYSSHFLGQY